MGSHCAVHPEHSPPAPHVNVPGEFVGNTTVFAGSMQSALLCPLASPAALTRSTHLHIPVGFLDKVKVFRGNWAEKGKRKEEGISEHRKFA